MIALMFLYPQVYFDVAVINWYVPRAEFHAYLERLVNAGFAERIMFGSDQMQWPAAIEAATAGIESAPFLSGDATVNHLLQQRRTISALGSRSVRRGFVTDRLDDIERADFGITGDRYELGEVWDWLLL
jgi:hypothetical protein